MKLLSWLTGGLTDGLTDKLTDELTDELTSRLWGWCFEMTVGLIVLRLIWEGMGCFNGDSQGVTVASKAFGFGSGNSVYG